MKEKRRRQSFKIPFYKFWHIIILRISSLCLRYLIPVNLASILCPECDNSFLSSNRNPVETNCLRYNTWYLMQQQLIYCFISEVISRRKGGKTEERDEWYFFFPNREWILRLLFRLESGFRILLVALLSAEAELYRYCYFQEGNIPFGAILHELRIACRSHFCFQTTNASKNEGCTLMKHIIIKWRWSVFAKMTSLEKGITSDSGTFVP